MEGQGSLVTRTMSNSKSHANYTPTHMADMESAKETSLAGAHYPIPCELELHGQQRFPLELSLVVLRCQNPRIRARHSAHAGVSLAYLMGDFSRVAYDWSGEDDPTFLRLKEAGGSFVCELADE